MYRITIDIDLTFRVLYIAYYVSADIFVSTGLLCLSIASSGKWTPLRVGLSEWVYQVY